MKTSELILIILSCLVLCAGCNEAVNKFAFYPDRASNIPPGNLPRNVQEIYIKTADNINIQSYFISDKSSDKLLVYFHGNAGNIGHRLQDLIKLGSFGINVLGVGYRGYGKSQGTPSEAGIYIDGKSALNYATDLLGFTMENIIIMGRSIGTTVAIHVSQDIRVGGLILVTPLTSGEDLAKASGFGIASFLARGTFNNLSKIKKVSCPTLVIHGSLDKVIPVEMGEAIFNSSKSEKQFITIDGANHNDLSTRYQEYYWPPIKRFINQMKNL